jgi:hypothetical protein
MTAKQNRLKTAASTANAQTASMITFLSPGLRIFHQQPSVNDVQHFHERLLSVLAQTAVRDGEWRLLECVPAWDGTGLRIPRVDVEGRER